MGAQFTIPLITTIPGQLIASALWNNEFFNINTNFIPAGMDSYSLTDSQMQIQTNPFPGNVTSHASNLGGEIERLRYQIAQIIGQTFWYQNPQQSTPTYAKVTVNGTTPSYVLSESGTPQAQIIIDSNNTYIDFGGVVGSLVFRTGIGGTIVMTLTPTVLDLGAHKIQNVVQGSNAGEVLVFPITASQISNGTITGTQIASSVALAGSPTTSTPSTNDSTTKIATTAFVNPSNSISSNGYQKLASGLIIQWGISGVLPTNTNSAISFPLAFPNHIFSVTVTPRYTNASTNNTIVTGQIGNMTLSQFSYANKDTTTSYDVSWMAIGN